MRKRLITTLAMTCCLCTAAFATDIDVAIEADGCFSSTITVAPECEISFYVVAELSDAASQGLALYVFDLAFDGGALSPVTEPSVSPMSNFVPPLGFNGNPDGYGGTVIGGALIQIGGAQNLFNHNQWFCEDDTDCPGEATCNVDTCTPIAGLPTGTVITGIAQAGSPEILATGTIVAPVTPGTYTVSLANVMATVIRSDATGDPMWMTEVAAGVGTFTDLSITVVEGGGCCDAAPPPLPEDSLGETCADDGECSGQAACVSGVCYAPKHRYISIARNPDQAPSTARRVSLVGGGAGPWWIDTPFTNGILDVARLTDTPVYSNSDFAADWPDVLHVSDCEIATNQVYEVQSIAAGADIGDEGAYSQPIALHTPTIWGDVVSTCFSNNCLPPDGAVGIDDILAEIAKFQSIDNAPITWLDIASSQGSDVPNVAIDIGDILAVIGGFQAEVYPGVGPTGCP